MLIAASAGPVVEEQGLNRRDLLRTTALVGFAVASGVLASGCAVNGADVSGPNPSPASPLALPLTLANLFHHSGISVPDVAAAARFYSQLFGGQNVNGEREPFVRYFIKLNPGEVAIGKLGTLGSTGRTVPLIDHICVDAVPFDDAAWRARLAAEGRQYIAQGVFLGIDNIPVQVAGGEGGESLATGEVTQMPSLYDGPALVAPRGFDHVVMVVSNLAAASTFWQRMFGLSELAEEAGVLWLGNGGTARLGLRLALQGEDVGAVYQAVRGVYEPENTRSALQGLGARLLPALAYDAPGSIRFSGPDGIETLLVPTV